MTSFCAVPIRRILGGRRAELCDYMYCTVRAPSIWTLCEETRDRNTLYEFEYELWTLRRILLVACGTALHCTARHCLFARRGAARHDQYDLIMISNPILFCSFLFYEPFFSSVLLFYECVVSQNSGRKLDFRYNTLCGFDCI